MRTELAADCPVCLSAGSIVRGRCQLCEAQFGEAPDGAVDLPPAAPPVEITASMATEFPPLRFSDVIEELRDVGSLVSDADGAIEIEVASRRLQALLCALRAQFLSDIVVDTSRGRVSPRAQRTSANS